MRKRIIVGAAMAVVTLAGYRLGAGTWPSLHTSTRPAESGPIAGPAIAAIAATAERKVLYWKAPDGSSDFSPAP